MQTEKLRHREMRVILSVKRSFWNSKPGIWGPELGPLTFYMSFPIPNLPQLLDKVTPITAVLSPSFFWHF